MLPMRAYDWFRVHVRKSKDGRYSIHVTSFLGDRKLSEDISPPYDEAQADALLLMIESSLREGKPIGHENLKRIGEQLYKCVFSDEIKEYFERCLKIAKRNCGLRVELVIDPLYLRRLPWELMHDGKDFLTLSTVTPIVRTVLQAEPPQFPEVSFPLGILFVAASPVESRVPINVGGEIRRLCKGVSKAIIQGRACLRCYSAGKIRSQEFLDDIRGGKYHVLHMSSHGAFVDGIDKGFLELEDDEGRAILVSIETLGAWIKDSNVQMVYLDACQTAVGSVRTPLADLSHVFLNKGVGAALAMQFSVPDESAIKFCETFYSRLVRQEPIELALSEARKRTVDLAHGLDKIDWAIPTLYIGGRGILRVSGERKPKRTYKPLPSLGIFIGRREKLNQLAKDLIDPEVSVIPVDGFGGIGKSSIVNKLVTDVGHLFVDVCWIDCRPKISYDKVVDEINEMLLYHGIGFTSSELAKYFPEEKNNRIAYVLEEKADGFLVVFDNFDSVRDDMDIRNLIQKISEGKKTKVLVTVRIPVSLVRKQRFFRLDKLEEDDAILLMRNLARQYDIQSVERAEKSVLKKINARVDGHPKAIEVVIPRLKTEPLERVLERLPQVLAGDIGPILEWSFKNLTAEEKEFLLEISVYEEEVPYDALRAVHIGGYSPPVKELVEKSLLSYDTKRELYSLHPLVREFAYRRLRRERKRKLHRLAARYFSSKEVKDPISAIYHTYKAEDWKRGMYLTSEIFEILVLRGLWTEAKSLCEQGLIASRKTGNDQMKSYFLFNLGRLYYRFGNYDEAEKLYKQSLEIDKSLGHTSGVSKTLHQLAMVQQKKGNYDEAEKLYKQSLEIDKSLRDKSGIALTFGQLGRLSETRNQLNLAKEYYEKALQIFRQLGEKTHTNMAEKDLNRIKTKIKKEH